MNLNKYTFAALYALSLILSVLVIIYPGLPGELLGTVGRVLVLSALFSLILLLRFSGGETADGLFWTKPVREEESTLRLTVDEQYMEFLEASLRLINRLPSAGSAYFFVIQPDSADLSLKNSSFKGEGRMRETVPLSHRFFRTGLEQGQPSVHLLKPGDDAVNGVLYSKGPLPSAIVTAPVVHGKRIMGFLAVECSGSPDVAADLKDALFDHSRQIADVTQYLEKVFRLERETGDLSRELKFMTEAEAAESSQVLLRSFADLCSNYFAQDVLAAMLVPLKDTGRCSLLHTEGDKGAAVQITALKDAPLWMQKALTDPGDTDKHGCPKGVSCAALVFRMDNAHKLVLGIQRFKSLNFTKKELEVFRRIGLNFVSAFRRINLYERLDRIESVDALTGTLNGRMFTERLFEEINRAKRYSYRTAYLRIVVGKYRQMRDIHGADFADFLILRISDILKKSVRNVDIIARSGEDEFRVLLPNCGRSSAAETAARIRQTVEESEFVRKDVREKVKVALYAVSYPEDAEDAESLEKYVKPL